MLPGRVVHLRQREPLVRMVTRSRVEKAAAVVVARLRPTPTGRLAEPAALVAGVVVAVDAEQIPALAARVARVAGVKCGFILGEL